MKLQEYLDTDKLEEQIVLGNVNRNFHKKFTNLAIYTYSKQCTMDYAWNEITCKCRGLIVDTSTWEVIARPFEKLFNVGERAFPEYSRENWPDFPPEITDKLDGNLITLYLWAGRWWAASKGSFHSEHADWANKWLEEDPRRFAAGSWPPSFTPVFEMIAEELEHHVVHYGTEASGLYLLAMIRIDTGEELNKYTKAAWAEANNVIDVPVLEIELDKALAENEKNAEGYVLTWNRPLRPPFRVKVKFVEFLRLQKLVHNVGPKEILDYMSHPHLQCYLEEALNPESSHEEFIKYVRVWMDRFATAYRAVQTTAAIEMAGLRKLLHSDSPRKDWAEKIKQCQYPAIMFTMLDEDIEAMRKQIWKRVAHVAEQKDDVRSLITQEE